MPFNPLSTSKIAKIVGCHPNTVHMYEAWGSLPPVPRAANGYRLYTEDHLYQMRLARTALNTPRPDEYVFHATDHWLSTLDMIEESARKMIEILEDWLKGKR